MQSKPQDAAICCLTWTSMPLKKDADFRLCHNMISRFTRHCPPDEGDEAQGEGSSKEGAAARPTRKPDGAPRLVQRDYEVLDILCSASCKGALRRSAVLGPTPSSQA